MFIVLFNYRTVLFLICKLNYIHPLELLSYLLYFIIAKNGAERSQVSLIDFERDQVSLLDLHNLIFEFCKHSVSMMFYININIAIHANVTSVLIFEAFNF